MSTTFTQKFGTNLKSYQLSMKCCDPLVNNIEYIHSKLEKRDYFDTLREKTSAKTPWRITLRRISFQIFKDTFFKDTVF